MLIGIVAEGKTDRAVLEALVTGALAGLDLDLEFNAIQPPPDDEGAHGGWGLVLDWLRRERYREALPFIDLLIVQIDTDECEKPGFGVSRRDGARQLDHAELTARVSAFLTSLIAEDFLAANRDRIIFAIAVDEIECWLLPLYFDDDNASRTTGCYEKLHRELDRRNLPGLKKEYRAYQQAARELRKRKAIEKARRRSPSLTAFIAELERKVLPAAPPAADE